MKFFWFGIVLLAFCAICEVISDYTDSMLPLKDIRNRVHRTMRMNMRVGKRFGDSEYDEEAPQRRLRGIVRTGKRALNMAITPNTFTPLYTSSISEHPDIDSENLDFKRCLPQFLQNPRVGKNDKTWKFNSAGTLHKRSDPKATDMWFGPRIGRSNEEPYEDLPWAYVLVNGNRPINGAVFKSNEVEDQPRDDLPE
ncbi:hypothetical protein HUJ04_010554 [Dendroctonus ponderosae]|uniref:Uncharacterized protein n=1 Tax=Dendroctonus ponderosae TaxID=77166 RepID=A0AAR5P750_DENPD|nr:hypothetical protein HUJ04_010548 [Dendroctonus ponderosae]KAH1020969.1 hypothetical protein HUJ04_010554 [Dendroctonus ponderosae]